MCVYYTYIRYIYIIHIHVSITESLCCMPEILWINYTSVKNVFKKEGKISLGIFKGLFLHWALGWVSLHMSPLKAFSQFATALQFSWV